MGRTPCAPILQLGSPAPSPGSHPHLWFLLGSPWGPERPPARRGLPHPLGVLSRLETTLGAGMGHATPLTLRSLGMQRCRNGEAGRGLSCMQKSNPTKQGPEACSWLKSPQENMNTLSKRQPLMRQLGPLPGKPEQPPSKHCSKRDCWGWSPVILRKKR